MSTSVRNSRSRGTRSSFTTTANQLTVLRIVFVPVFIILLAYHEIGWALSTFVVAGITDVLDGLIARRFGQKTSIGAVLDPIADKLLMTAAILILSLPQMGFHNSIPRWLMIVIISRDVFILLVSSDHGVDGRLACLHAKSIWQGQHRSSGPDGLGRAVLELAALARARNSTSSST